MSSFYGGKQGRTYHIVQRYDSVQLMCEAFAGGGAYTDANYGLYVIIDTVLNDGRSNRLNGLLYRRGFDYNLTIQSVPVKQNTLTDELFKVRWNEYVQHPGAGAIYVGQIVGTEGRTPEVTIEQWSDFQAQSTASGTGAFGSTSSIILEQNTTGKTDDLIKVGYVNIRDIHGDTTGGYIAIDIPKHVQLAQVVEDNPYYNASVVLSEESEDHPLYYKWNFTIPHGKHGLGIKLIKILDSYDIGQGEYRKTTDKEIKNLKYYYINDGEGFSRVQNPVLSDLENYYEADKYFTYTSVNYDNGQPGDSDAAAAQETGHLGRWPYRVIDGVTLINSERSIVTWEHLTHVEVGDLYRTDSYATDMYWVCLKAGRIIDSDTTGVDGDNIPYEAAHDSVPDIVTEDQIGTIINNLQETIWRAVNIPLTAPAHSITIAYTAGEDDEFDRVLRNVDYLSVDNVGNLYAFYSDNIDQSYYLTNIGGLKTGSSGLDRGVVVTDDSIKFIYTNGSVLTYPLKQILSIDFYTGSPRRNLETGLWMYDELGRVIFDNYELDSTLKIRYKDDSSITFSIPRISRISYNKDDLTNSQDIVINYIGGDTNTVALGINRIVAMDRVGDNIIILYSDPDIRSTIQQQGQENIDWIKWNWIDNSTNPPTQYTGSNALVWLILGSTSGKYHIQGEYHYADLKGDPEYSDYDANTYIDLSLGFQGELLTREGWLATVTDDLGVRHIYAFDYNDIQNDPPTYLIGNEGDTFNSHWYELMSLAAEDIQPNLFVVVQENLPIGANLKDGMLWFPITYGHDENV